MSTDGGKTYKSLANANTACDLDPTADQKLVDNCPGFNGDSGGWTTQTFDLTPYAGQSVLLSFRYITDANTHGVYLDNIAVGGTVVSDGSSLSGWQSPTQIQPTPVKGWTVQLVAYQTSGSLRLATLLTVSLPPGFRGGVDLHRLLANAIGRRLDVVAALVMQDDPSETITKEARYTLKVNGVTQPGG